MMNVQTGTNTQNSRSIAITALWKLFLRLGVLPFLLVIALVVFGLTSDQFFTERNLLVMLRQSVYLVLVSLGQMLALVTGGFDLSVGTIIALTSVISALAMVTMPELSPGLIILVGCMAGIAAALAIGLINGIGIAYLGVSPFIMTLGMQSIGFGLALYLTGGVPVSGLPDAFGDIFGFGVWFGLPTPIVLTGALALIIYLVMTRTALGTYFLATGGNEHAARLSGINVRHVLVLAYVIGGVLAGLAGLLLTARVGTGEANLGGNIALESIAACVIAGVSLRGGIGRVENVVLGAIFIILVQNGMNLTGIDSYMQLVVLGVLLIIAVIADAMRYKLSRNA